MINKENVSVYPHYENLAEAFASELYKVINLSLREGRNFNMALSGGNTPKALFNILAQNYMDKIPWAEIHFFWGDERCVAPYNMESNYGMARRYLLDKIPIPSENVHRIRGENAPYREALRYTDEIKKHLPARDGFPVFDIILLGMGEDGHTASIFPDQLGLFNSPTICAVTKHPVTGQHRVTLTGPVINNASHIYFLVTGSNKAPILKHIFNSQEDKMKYPAAFIQPKSGNLFWFLDEDAAGQLISK
ncbi:MAG: 6-phosphogluconolactonase [Bacteroidales bacterium]|nr:6-phosphogluconolactonase [Bacteroidales bacterium]